MKIVNRHWYAIWVDEESKTFCMCRHKSAAKVRLKEVKKLFPGTKFGIMFLTQRVELKRKYRKRRKRSPRKVRSGYLNATVQP